MKIAIMQPYFAPHMAYFQLIQAVDKFVFLDDVNFIKGGWINRNVITLNSRPHRFSIPLKQQSSFRKINEVEVDWASRDMTKLTKTLRQRFRKDSASRKIIEVLIEDRPTTIANLAIESVKRIASYLGIKTEFASSHAYRVERVRDGTRFLVDVCQQESATTYVNSIGGKQLYRRSDFRSHDIDLRFLEGKQSASMLDVIDNDSRQQVVNDLIKFRLT